MTIYISGPITGVKNAKKNFIEAEKELRKRHGEYVKIINPFKIAGREKCKTWSDFMRLDIAELVKADAIYMLKGADNSKGAMLERDIAKNLELFISWQR